MSRDSEKGKYASPDGSPIWEYLASASCALLIFVAGCGCGWMSPNSSMLMKPDSPIKLESSDVSNLMATTTVGFALAPMLALFIGHKLGRKNGILASCIPSIISWATISLTTEIVILTVARFIDGLSIGLTLILPPLYLGEIASVKLRGAIGMVCGTMLNAGVLFMFLVVPYLSIHRMANVCCIMSILAAISIWFVPESPYFLATIGRFEEAEEALEKLRGKTNVGEELDLIKLTVSQKDKPAATLDIGGNENGLKKFIASWKRLFTVPGNRKALVIILLFSVILQFGSYISIIAYAHIIFEKMETGISVNLCTIIVGILQLVFNILTAFIIDKLGRRPLLVVSGIVSGAGALVVAIYFYLLEYAQMDVTPYAMFALGAVFVNIVATNIGVMPLQMVIQSEVLDTEIKEMVSCLSGVWGGILGTIGTKSYLMVAETWQLGHTVPFILFPIVSWFGTALLVTLLPETRGKTFLEIQKDLNA